jgi:hypothetical protein
MPTRSLHERTTLLEALLVRVPMKRTFGMVPSYDDAGDAIVRMPDQSTMPFSMRTPTEVASPP